MRAFAGATNGLRRILDLLLVALIGLLLLGVLLGKLVPLTGRQTMIVGGSSMEPAIGLGAAVIIAPVTADELRIGDVVSLRAGDENAIFTHRIVSVVDRPDGRWIGTKGDANAEPDPTIMPASAVIGRSELSIPYAGYLLQLLSMPTGVLFLIGLAATLLAAAWLLETQELDRAGQPVDAVSPAVDRAAPQRRAPTIGTLRRAPRRPH
jgi:signal peptidase